LSCGLGGAPSGGFDSGGGGGGPLGGFIGSCRGSTQLLDRSLGESLPRRQGISLYRGRGAVLRGLLGGLKGRPHCHLSRYCCSSGHSSHDQLLLQLSQHRAAYPTISAASTYLSTELIRRARSPPTRHYECLSRTRKM
jgi:hypothetical protein